MPSTISSLINVIFSGINQAHHFNHEKIISFDTLFYFRFINFFPISTPTLSLADGKWENGNKNKRTRMSALTISLTAPIHSFFERFFSLFRLCQVDSSKIKTKHNFFLISRIMNLLNAFFNLAGDFFCHFIWHIVIQTNKRTNVNTECVWYAAQTFLLFLTKKKLFPKENSQKQPLHDALNFFPLIYSTLRKRWAIKVFIWKKFLLSFPSKFFSRKFSANVCWSGK